jgi:hypothetical protein
MISKRPFSGPLFVFPRILGKTSFAQPGDQREPGAKDSIGKDSSQNTPRPTGRANSSPGSRDDSIGNGFAEISYRPRISFDFLFRGISGSGEK